ncbi:MAG: putative haloacid dehalogenase-like hydrolase family protein [Thermoleophilia bacterium]|nr:putative haloacid dehalogenase-like hydrolase family protein [Thermoleophilia bacterium]
MTVLLRHRLAILLLAVAALAAAMVATPDYRRGPDVSREHRAPDALPLPDRPVPRVKGQSERQTVSAIESMARSTTAMRQLDLDVGAGAPAGSVRATFGSRFRDGVTLQAGAASLQVVPLSGRDVPALRQAPGDAQSVVYVGAHAGTDVVQTLTGGALKEAIIVRSPRQRRAQYGFRLSGSPIPFLTADGGVGFRLDGRMIAARIVPPAAVDASGRRLPRSATRYVLHGRVLTLVTQLPASAAWPVVVDPTFDNGQGADAVIGTRSFTDSAWNQGRRSFGLSQPISLGTDGTRLLVSDNLLTQVKVWNTVPAGHGADWDTDFQIGSHSGGVWTNGTKTVVTNAAHQIRIHNSFPGPSSSPNLVLGQPGGSGSVPNNGGRGPSSSFNPHGIWSDGTRLVVADTDNNRVLVWTSWPTSQGQPADLVLGQAGFDDGACNRGNATTAADRLCQPWDVWSDGTRLYVTDRSNHRVVGWSTFPTTSGQSADFVLGQSSLTTRTANVFGAASKGSLNLPRGIHGEGTRLVLTDEANQRVLVWNTLPTSTNVAADVRLGVTGVVGTTSTHFWSPVGAVLIGGKVAVADVNNNRVLVWNSVPATDGAPADVVIGHPVFNRSGMMDNRGDAPYTINGVALDAQRRVHLASVREREVFRYPAALPATGATSDFTFAASVPGEMNGLGSSHIEAPCGFTIAKDGTAFISRAYSGGAAVKIWKPAPGSGAPPFAFTGVLGQPSMGAGGSNRNGSPGANTIASDTCSADTDGTRVAVADTGNHRVLVWTSFPTTPGQAADLVLGQPNFTSASPNAGGLSSSTLNNPTSVRFDGGRLFVADQGNNRVLIWNRIPTASMQPADVVLGQPNQYANAAGLGPSQLNQPYSVAADHGMLAVSDTGNRRVLIWNTIPTTTYQAADRVIGQVNFTSAASASTQAGLQSPREIDLRDGRLVLSDNQRRALVYDDLQAPTVSSIEEQVSSQQATISWRTDEDAVSTLYWDTVSRPGGAGYAFSAGSNSWSRDHSIAALGLTSGTVYYYRVQSVDAKGNLTLGTERSFTTRSTTRLVASSSFADDATVSETNATFNFGGHPELTVGGSAGSVRHGLLRFDLSQLPPSATIVSAQLRLTQTANGGGGTPSIDAYRMQRGWTEGLGTGTPEPSGATWQSFDGVDPWTAPGGDFAATRVGTAAAPAAVGAAMDMDVTGLVSDWVAGTYPNEGVLLRADPPALGELRSFASSEHTDASRRPVLTVVWQGADATPPQLDGFQVDLLSASSVKVSWNSDEETIGSFRWGPTATYGTTVPVTTSSNFHSVTLTGLQPNSTFHYSVLGSDSHGNQTVSADRAFRTSFRLTAPAADTFMRSDAPSFNAGRQASLFVGNNGARWGESRALLRFDTTSIPAAATIRDARVDLFLTAQRDGTAPPLDLHRLANPFAEGTGAPLISPRDRLVTATSSSSEPTFGLGHSRHLVRNGGSWWHLYGAPDQWVGAFLWGRRSGDGLGFSSNEQHGTAWGAAGVGLAVDGSDVWAAGLHRDGYVVAARYRAGTGAELARTSYSGFTGALHGGADASVSANGHVWLKVESNAGSIQVVRSTAPRDLTSWQAPQEIDAQAAPGHAQLIPLAGDRMLALLQDGPTLSTRTWNGSSWSAESPVAANVAQATPWISEVSFAGVPDGAGGAWVAWRTTTNDLVTQRFDGTTWAATETVAASLSATGPAITLDSRTGEPHVAWRGGSDILRSWRSAGAWQVPVVQVAGVHATSRQLSMSDPSAESLAVQWAEQSGSQWNALASVWPLARPADGATWSTRDGSTSWSAAGGDSAAVVASAPAPTLVGNPYSFALTAQVRRWHQGIDPNNGLMLSKTTPSAATDDWKAFHSSEAVNPDLRPTLTVDYDVATVTVTQPTGSTAWSSSSSRELTWQTIGSGLDSVDISYSADGGATFPFTVATDLPNNGHFLWTTPSAEGSSYRIRIAAKNEFGTVMTTNDSPSFVIDDTPPSPVTDLAIASPSANPVLSWTQPADAGGAGMAAGTYRIFRSSSSGTLGTRVATVSSVGWTDTASLADGTWYYTVQPVDAAGNATTAGNSQDDVVVDRQAPNAVTTLSGPGLSRTSFSLAWSPVTDNGPSGVSSYRLYRSTTSGLLGSVVATVAGGPTADLPLADGTYYYTVVPVDLAGNARMSGNNQTTVVFDTTAPAPTGLLLDGGAAWTSNRTVTATLTGADASEFQLSEDPSFAGATWQPAAASAPFLLDDADGAHVVYARYRDAAGNVSPVSTDGIGLDRTAPSAVSSTAIASGSTAAATSVQWSAATDAGSGVAYYRVFESAVSGVAGPQVNVDGATTGGSFSLGSVAPGTDRWITVKAVDALGTERATGNTQLLVRYDAPGAPTLVSPGSVGAPRVAVDVDGVAAGTFEIPNEGLDWGTFSNSFAIAAGTHTITLTFINDANWTCCVYDRNVHLDSLTLLGSGEVIEAESMTGTGMGPVINHASASGGQYLAIYHQGISRSATITTTGATGLQLRAAGDRAADPNTLITSTSPTLTGTFLDPQAGETGRLDFELCSTWDCSSVVAGGSSAGGVAAGSNAAWTVPVTLTRAVKYYWRARSTDQRGLVGPWSKTNVFVVERLPTQPPLVSPAADSATSDDTPTLRATFADPDTGDLGTIAFEVCTSVACNAPGDPIAAGSSASNVVTGSDGSWTSGSLATGTYWWRARGTDALGGVGPWSTTRQLRIGAPALTVGLDAATAAFGVMVPGVDATNQRTISITSDSASGYSLQATGDSDARGMTHSGGVHGIPNWTGTDATPTTWATGVAGYAGLTVVAATGGKDTARWGTATTATDFANLRFAGMRTTPTTLFTQPGFTGGTEQVDVAFRSNPSPSTPSGTYSANVSFTVTALP